MPALSLIPPPFRKLSPVGTAEGPSPPRSSLEGTAAVPRLKVGWVISGQQKSLGPECPSPGRKGKGKAQPPASKPSASRGFSPWPRP